MRDVSWKNGRSTVRQTRSMETTMTKMVRLAAKRARMARPIAMRLAILAGFVWSASASAVSTQVWVNQTYADFNQGEGHGVLVDSRGLLRPGIVLKRRGVKGVSLVFAMLERGAKVYLGTGDKGEVWVYDGVRVKKLSSLPGAVLVTSLVAGPKTTIYAGTIPEGKIFAIDTRTGKARLFAKLKAKHIWAMVAEPKTGAIFAGTGPKGELYRISAAGKAVVYWKAPDKHVLALTYGPGGSLYAGTSPKAIVYRIVRRGTARAVHDFDATEVRALAGNRRVLYAAVNKMKGPKTWSVKVPSRHKPAGTAVHGVVRKRPPEIRIPRLGAKKGVGGVFRIWGTGAVDQLYGLKQSYFTSLEVTGNDDVYAAEGTRGQVLLLGRDHSVATVADVKERQALSLHLTGRLRCIGTGDAGALHVVVPRGARRYLSKAFDAGSASRWGRLDLAASGNLAIETRTGNTAKPDAGWSRWQPLARLAMLAGGRRGGLVASQPGRYVQYRVTLRSPRARVTGVRLYFVPINRRARIKTVKIGKQGNQKSKTKVLKASWLTKVTSAAPSSFKVTWTVDNPDGDALVYRVYYRAIGTALWRKLGWSQTPLTGTSVTWKTVNLPDGWYLVRVVASDERSNAAGRSKTDTWITEPFLVDNVKPSVRALVVRTPRVFGIAVDSFSHIVGVQYSLDAQNWFPVDPTDGAFDQRAENFSFTFPAGIKRGPVLLLIRVFDEAGNAVVVKKAFQMR